MKLSKSLRSVRGVIQKISQLEGCCSELIYIITPEGPVNLLLDADTYVVDSVRMRVGMRITGFYDAMLPIPLIYPPQYRAQVIAMTQPNENLMIEFFDENLVSSDNSLKLNIGRMTNIVTANGQVYTCDVGNNNLIVYYDTTTRSIPPQTTPHRIIVLCPTSS